MSTIDSLIASFQFNRTRTLGLLDKILQQPAGEAILAWRPAPGRAHIAWQLMHVGITEELFATERLVPGSTAAYGDLVPRFKGGSTPDDNIPSAAQIREVLAAGREHLLATLSTFSDADLSTIPEAFKERKLSIHDVLHIINWHEAHHQGQAHITLNLFLASNAK